MRRKGRRVVNNKLWCCLWSFFKITQLKQNRNFVSSRSANCNIKYKKCFSIRFMCESRKDKIWKQFIHFPTEPHEYTCINLCLIAFDLRLEGFLEYKLCSRSNMISVMSLKDNFDLYFDRSRYFKKINGQDITFMIGTTLINTALGCMWDHLSISPFKSIAHIFHSKEFFKTYAFDNFW